MRLGSEDWEAYRAIRLAALAEAPSAFGSSLASERRLTEHEWRTRLSNRAQFVVQCAERTVGTAGGVVDDGAELVSMWVHPDTRGEGVGDLLVKAVLEWARAEGYADIHLWVSVGNAHAERLYARNGFVRTGAEQLVNDADPTRREFRMARPLGSACRD
jgi:GNAT superfamily N-acetyltransferase